MTSPASGTGARRGGASVRLDLPAARRGERLDQVLVALLPDQSRSALQRLIREGRVTLPEGPARPSYRVRGGEQVTVELPPPRPSDLAAEARPLAILYQDMDLVVLDKSAGMAVHPGAGARSGTLVNVLLHHCRDLSGVGGTERPGIVHRLDRETTGVMVVAKNDMTHRALAAQFKARTVEKVYEALVWGRPRLPQGVVDAPIGRHPTARVKMAVRPGGRPARTGYKLLAALGPVAHLELRPATGRTHQIRVHLKSLGHPIVGDRLYGGARVAEVRDPSARAALRAYGGLALHARSLGFDHPRTGERRHFEAPLPTGLRDLLDALGRGSGSPPATGSARS